jgi:hypothetical protein
MLQHPDGYEYGRSPRGEAHPRAKLTEADVLEIRRLHREGAGGYGALAERFGVSRSVIQSVVQRRSWAHVG